MAQALSLNTTINDAGIHLLNLIRHLITQQDTVNPMQDNKSIIVLWVSVTFTIKCSWTREEKLAESTGMDVKNFPPTVLMLFSPLLILMHLTIYHFA